MDTIARVSSFPEPDSRTVAYELITAGGGPAATAAVAAARAGARTAFLGTVGADDEGDRILAGLEAEDIDTSAVRRDPSQPSGASVVVVGPGATRAIVTRPVPRVVVHLSAAARLLEEAAWVHVDHLGWPALRTLRLPKRTFRVSVDAGNPLPAFSLTGVDLYGPTLARLAGALQPTDPAEIEALLRTSHEAGAGMIVATDGERGSWVLDEAGRFVHVPAAKCDAYSTLGAGDVFHGALLAAMAAGLELADAAGFASKSAASSCEGLDGRSRIPYARPRPPAATENHPSRGISGHDH